MRSHLLVLSVLTFAYFSHSQALADASVGQCDSKLVSSCPGGALGLRDRDRTDAEARTLEPAVFEGGTVGFRRVFRAESCRDFVTPSSRTEGVVYMQAKTLTFVWIRSIDGLLDHCSKKVSVTLPAPVKQEAGLLKIGEHVIFVTQDGRLYRTQPQGGFVEILHKDGGSYQVIGIERNPHSGIDATLPDGKIVQVDIHDGPSVTTQVIHNAIETWHRDHLGQWVPAE